MIETNWTSFKQFVTARGVSLQYLDINGDYHLVAIDGPFSIKCFLPQDGSADVLDFEINYKANGNKSPIQATLASTYTAKTLVINGLTKKLYARNTGITASVTTGSNQIDYTATYPHVKIVGVECINSEALDSVDMKVYDTPAGTYSGIPNQLLNQFAYSVMLPKDFYQRISQFDADLYQGMVLRFNYTSVSNKTVGFNLIMSEVKS